MIRRILKVGGKDGVGCLVRSHKTSSRESWGCLREDMESDILKGRGERSGIKNNTSNHGDQRQMKGIGSS